MEFRHYRQSCIDDYKKLKEQNRKQKDFQKGQKANEDEDFGNIAEDAFVLNT